MGTVFRRRFKMFQPFGYSSLNTALQPKHTPQGVEYREYNCLPGIVCGIGAATLWYLIFDPLLSHGRTSSPIWNWCLHTAAVSASLLALFFFVRGRSCVRNGDSLILRYRGLFARRKAVFNRSEARLLAQPVVLSSWGGNVYHETACVLHIGEDYMMLACRTDPEVLRADAEKCSQALGLPLDLSFIELQDGAY